MSELKKEDKKALTETLELVGIKNLKLPTIIAFSGAKRDQNKKVHEQTNRLILDLLASDNLGECIHVTGEMRALTDSFHRQLCEEIQRRTKKGFQVLYNLPEENRQDASSIVSWNVSRWNSKYALQWKETLRSINAIANESVKVLAFNTLNEVQYSVFGDKYIQLQEKHNDEAGAKRIWLIESKKINNHLVERGINLIDRAESVNQHLFKRFTLNVSGIAARRYLTILSEGSKVELNNLFSDVFIREIEEDIESPFHALKIMNFIDEDKDGLCKITSSGIDFLKSY